MSIHAVVLTLKSLDSVYHSALIFMTRELVTQSVINTGIFSLINPLLDNADPITTILTDP